jgi:heat-inducible transcriptional repressor
MLTERRKLILQHIIDEYVRTAQPVGSSAIVKRYDMSISSATIRNEMAALEEEGYIAQPHTSAGRTPTDAGYRYYVHSLMQEESPSDDLQQTIRHQFHQAARELEEWARLTAAILASRLQNAALVTTPHSSQPRVRLIELVSVHDHLALLIVVLQEARVVQQTLPVDPPMSQDELAAVARKLNALIAGKTATELRDAAVQLSDFENSVVSAATALLEASDESTLEPSFMEGVRDLLKQPEFLEGRRVLGLLEVLEGRNLPKAIPAPQGEGVVSVVIGHEHPVAEMQMCSVITTSYAGPSGLRGVVGIVGPTRMHYSRNVAMARYMSTLMGELLNEYFA